MLKGLFRVCFLLLSKEYWLFGGIPSDVVIFGVDIL